MLVVAAGILIIVLIGLSITLGLCEAAGKEDREKENQKYDLWVNCDDDCYMCDFQNKCKKSAMKDV